MNDPDREEPNLPAQDVLDSLVARHREFLAFLERRLGGRELAEDVLQDAFVRGIDHLGELRESESARAWFYRTLRNALIDQARRRDAERRRLESVADELRDPLARGSDLDTAVCECVLKLAKHLKPEYADLLQRVDVEDQSLASYARAIGIAENNAAVRAFRARAALRREVTRSCGTCAEHGCLDCSCRGSKGTRTN